MQHSEAEPMILSWFIHTVSERYGGTESGSSHLRVQSEQPGGSNLFINI